MLLGAPLRARAVQREAVGDAVGSVTSSSGVGGVLLAVGAQGSGRGGLCGGLGPGPAPGLGAWGMGGAAAGFLRQDLQDQPPSRPPGLPAAHGRPLTVDCSSLGPSRQTPGKLRPGGQLPAGTAFRDHLSVDSAKLIL